MVEIDTNITLGTIIAIITAVATLVTLIAIIFFENRSEKNTKIALLNSVFDEIHHNLNISRVVLFLDESDDFLNSICHELERLYGPNSPYRDRVYPNPSDNPSLPPTHPDIEIFFHSVQLNHTANLPTTSNAGLIMYHTFSIERALSSGGIWTLTGKRAAQNLGHLYYSLKRIDLLKTNFMNGMPPGNTPLQYFNALGLTNGIDFQNLIFQYWLWLHFRLWFLYLDLALSSGKSRILKRDLIDHDHLRDIKCRVGEQEWNRLSKTLKKTRNR